MGKKPDWKQIAETFEFIKSLRALEVYPFLFQSEFLLVFFKYIIQPLLLGKNLNI